MIQEYQTCAAGYSCDKFTDLVIAQAFCPTCNTTTILGCAITYLNESCISEAVNSSVLDSCCNKTAVSGNHVFRTRKTLTLTRHCSSYVILFVSLK